MAVPYNYTNIANQTTIDGLFVAVHNDITGGWLGPIILFTIFFILLISFKGFRSVDSFTASSLITLLMGMLLNILGVVSTNILVAFLIIGSIGFLLMVRFGE